MKEVKLTREKMVSLAIAMKSYIENSGSESNKLSVACEKTLEYEQNIVILEAHDKDVSKLNKTLQRAIRDASYDFFTLKDGSFVKDDKGNFDIVPEQQKKLNIIVDDLNDKYEEDIYDLMKEPIAFYLPDEKVKDIPVRITNEYRKLLSILID